MTELDDESCNDTAVNGSELVTSGSDMPYIITSPEQYFPSFVSCGLGLIMVGLFSHVCLLLKNEDEALQKANAPGVMLADAHAHEEQIAGRLKALEAYRQQCVANNKLIASIKAKQQSSWCAPSRPSAVDADSLFDLRQNQVAGI